MNKLKINHLEILLELFPDAEWDWYWLSQNLNSSFAAQDESIGSSYLGNRL
jgi:hypothetical protein